MAERAFIRDRSAPKVHLLRRQAARLTFPGGTLRNCGPVIRRVTVLDWDNVTAFAVAKLFIPRYNCATAECWLHKSTDLKGDI